MVPYPVPQFVIRTELLKQGTDAKGDPDKPGPPFQVVCGSNNTRSPIGTTTLSLGTTYPARGRMRRLADHCSSRCAGQPVMRLRRRGLQEHGVAFQRLARGLNPQARQVRAARPFHTAPTPTMDTASNSVRSWRGWNTGVLRSLSCTTRRAVSEHGNDTVRIFRDHVYDFRDRWCAH